ncbi:MAG: dITP/XTP pyrophosphatase [Chlamydiales bacterium]|nr:dITP/XTP pyrophosphatase [Chlamydiales bacterium]MCH9634863.1 dITP/XTP pyrophosphatase [Chlamydiales bacterium]MCH9704153.1 XTP/dITP diphosphatase [Chlamydiota bacterium]
MKLILATTNAHKARELKALLKHLDYDIYTLMDFPDYVPPEETGKTFEENATLKAESAAKALGEFVVADDSGLVVPAINGEPGIYSARYAGEGASDKENRKRLLERMHNVHNRAAYFECAIALASPEGLVRCVRGTAEGEILEQERGGHGFGYDPLFVKHDYNQTFAELPEATKNKISHRAKALQKLLLVLESKATS